MLMIMVMRMKIKQKDKNTKAQQPIFVAIPNTLESPSWLTATQPKLTKCSTNMNYGSYVTALVP